ncbi:MAG: metallophosphoesterase [Candidatus Gastranaerophilaceae bacterium]|nr:metallophosphoesterase [Christensenellales bacterium]
MKLLFIIVFSLAAVSIFLWWQANGLGITYIEHSSWRLPIEFDGFRIAQVSDLHNKTFGKGNSSLLALLSREAPDIIVITGDLVDRRRPDINAAMEFIYGAVAIAPVYYVSGNHEERLENHNEIYGKLVNAGVHVLENTGAKILRGERSISIAGVFDSDSDTVISRRIETVMGNPDDFTILLCHRPNYMEIFKRYSLDLVFCGHAHGGQFRVPFVGGLFAPDQGLFPQYTSGAYTEGETTMIVSRGLGNSVVPIRLFNRPDVVMATLRSE